MFNFNVLSQKWINSYQKKISFYDKQQWERSLEDHIILRAENICGSTNSATQHQHQQQCNHNSLNNSIGKCCTKSHCNCNQNQPTTADTNKNDLIDLDLISGAAYTMKSKSQQGWLSSFVHAILRVLFLPIYLKWLSERTNPRLTILFLVLYLMQVTALRLYYHRGLTSFKIQNLPNAFNGNSTGSSSSKSSSNEFSEVPATEVLMPIAMMFLIGVIHTQIVGTKSSNSLYSSSSNSTKKPIYNNSTNCNGNNNSSINAAQTYNETESIYQIRHTECSSSPLSSTTCSADSSPASSVTPNNNRLFRNRQSSPPNSFETSKADLVNTADLKRKPAQPKIYQKHSRSNVINGSIKNKTIPRIRIHDEQMKREIILIDDNEVISDDDDDDDNDNVNELIDLNRNKINFKQVPNKSSLLIRERRYSDSKNPYSQLHNDDSYSLEETPRRFSESNSSTIFANYNRNRLAKTMTTTTTTNNTNTNDKLIMPALRRRNLTKTTKRHRTKLSNKKKSHFDLPWINDDNHLSLSPDTLNSSFKGFGFYGSSYDSEGTISPITPIASLPDDDWPMINSDANTSDEDEDNNFVDKKSILVLDRCCSSKKNQHHQPPPQRKQSKKLNNNYNHDSPSPCTNTNLTQEMPIANGNYNNNNSTTESYQAQHNFTNKKSPNNDYTSTPAAVQGFPQPDSIPSNELKVSCSVWQHNAFQKKDLSVMDISSSIIRKVESIEHSSEYIYLGILFSITIAILPTIFRMQNLLTSGTSANGINHQSVSPAVTNLLNVFNHSNSPTSTSDLIQVDLFGLVNLILDENLFFSKSIRVRCVVAIAMFERFALSLVYFFLLCVAERTFKQRFLYSKYFSQITRRDRAKRSQVPHFRLHKVRNLKVWLSVRSYLRRHGPHRSVDTICSTSFVIAVCLLTCISLQMLKESSDTTAGRLVSWEMVFWSLALGVYIMRLMILGSRINQKYRSNLSVLITEQINLYLQLERKPHKKDELMLANHVLKLAVDLLKELESPYKISGFSANPYLYNITKVVVLSAFSAVLTEMLGFKLKLYKIKLIR